SPDRAQEPGLSGGGGDADLQRIGDRGNEEMNLPTRLWFGPAPPPAAPAPPHKWGGAIGPAPPPAAPAPPHEWGGAICIILPSSVLINCHPPSCTSQWCRWQSRIRLDSSVFPPLIQCTRWCPSHREAGLSQSAHWQWPSRAFSARRAGPEMTRLERPTSTTTDSWSSRTRITLQSHAMRCTAVDETGSENSISPPVAPAKPFTVSTDAVICRLAGLPPWASSTSASALRLSWSRP